MADVIEYPSNRVEQDFVPQPGDRYEAYGLWHKIKPMSIFFVFADWTMQAFRCDQMEHFFFGLLNDKDDVHGRSVLTLSFGTAMGLYEVVITGDNIFGLCSNLDAVISGAGRGQTIYCAPVISRGSSVGVIPTRQMGRSSR